MRDAERLPLLRERAQLLAHDARGRAAHAGIDLVEHHRARAPAPVATVMSASITRESSPPDAISRSGPGGTPGFGAIRNSTASRRWPSRASGSPRRRAPGHAHLERASSIATSASSAAPRLREPTRRVDARGVSSDASSRHRLARAAASSCSRRAVSSLGAHEPVALGAAALGVLEHGRDRATVLALETRRQLEPLLERRETLRVGLEPAEIAAQLAAPMSCSSYERAEPRGERVEAGSSALAARSSSASTRPARERARRAVVALRLDRLGRSPGRARSVSTAASRDRSRSSSAFSSSVGRDGVDLRDLELQQVEVAIAHAQALRAAPRARARSRAPRAQALLEAPAPASCSVAAVGVEDLQLRRGQHQLAVLVLAEERQQPRADRAAARRPSPSGPGGTRGSAPPASRDGRAPARRRRAAAARPARRARGRRQSPGGGSNTPST